MPVSSENRSTVPTSPSPEGSMYATQLRNRRSLLPWPIPPPAPPAAAAGPPPPPSPPPPPAPADARQNDRTDRAGGHDAASDEERAAAHPALRLRVRRRGRADELRAVEGRLHLVDVGGRGAHDDGSSAQQVWGVRCPTQC